MSGRLRFEAWTLPTAATFEKVCDLPVLAASGTVELSAYTDVMIDIAAADWDVVGSLVISDSTWTLIRAFDGTTVIDEFVAERVAQDIDRPSVVTVSGPQLAKKALEGAGIFPFGYPNDNPAAQDWIWGGQNVLRGLALVDLQNINETWELHSFSDPFALTVDGQATTSLSNPSASAVEAALQALSTVEDVTVAGTGADADNPMTIIFYNPPDPTTVTVSTGTGTLTKIVEGALSPAPVTISEYADERVDPLVHGTYDDPAIEVDTTTVNTGSTWSLIVHALTRFAGSQMLVSVIPGQTYQVSVSVRPDTTSQFGLRIRDPLDDGDENPIAGVNATLTANTWTEMSLEVTIPPGVTTVIMRVAVIDGTPANIDDFRVDWEGARFSEGMAEATVGEIVRLLVEAAQARDVLDWVDISGFSDSADSDSVNWTSTLSFTAWFGEDMGHVMSDLSELKPTGSTEGGGYEWRLVPKSTPSGGMTHDLEVWEPGGGGSDLSASGGPSVMTGSVLGATAVSRVPPFTTGLVRGLGGLYLEDTNSTTEGNVGRWERMFDAEHLASETTLQEFLDRAFADEEDNRVALDARVSGLDPSVPLVDYGPGDKIWWQFPGVVSKVAKRVRRISWTHGDVATYRVQGSRVLSPEAAQAKAVDYLLRKFTRRRRDAVASAPFFGGGGGMAHILVVSDSEPQSVQSKADFVVPSSNSSTALQAVFDSVPSGSAGRWSIWMAGRFDLDADVTAPSGAWLRGLGSSFSGLPPI